MKKRLTMWGAGLLSLLLCVGCGSQTHEKPENTVSDDQKIVYSNLVDPTSQQEVATLLKGRGVSDDQIDTLLSWADDFNARVTSAPLKEGFQTMKKTGVDYSGLLIKNKEESDGFIDPEANCRLTSFLLMKDRIETNGKTAADDTILMFDAEAIDTYEPFRLSEEERSKFLSFFGWVPVQGAQTLEEHTACIQKAWAEREVTIGGEGISLITVYLHSPFDQVRFVGHTGVLLETEEGLMFVEKYGPQFPFQATKFHNRDELKQYILDRPDLYGDKTEVAPLVFENDHLL